MILLGAHKSVRSIPKVLKKRGKSYEPTQHYLLHRHVRKVNGLVITSIFIEIAEFIVLMMLG